jgi:predicted transcriptional regulator
MSKFQQFKEILERSRVSLTDRQIRSLARAKPKANTQEVWMMVDVASKPTLGELRQTLADLEARGWIRRKKSYSGPRQQRPH